MTLPSEARGLDEWVLVPLLAAWLLLGFAMGLTNGAYSGKAVALATIGLALTAVATWFVGRVPRVETGETNEVVAAAVAIALGGGLAGTIVFDAGIYGAGTALGSSRKLAVVAGIAAVAALLGPAAWRRAAWMSSVVTASLAGVLMILASPEPRIDVWYFLTAAARNLPRGINMYEHCLTVNTDPLSNCIYPYLPGTAIVQAPFQALFGDIRYSYVAALAGASFFVYQISPRRWAAALGALVLVQPKMLFLIEQAWPEPLMFVAIAATVWATLAGRHRWAVFAFAVAIATKQHVLLLVPLAAWWPAFGLRRALTSLAGGTAVVLAWFLAAPADFLNDALWFNLRLPPRLDSLSLYTTAVLRGWTPHFALVALVTLGTLCYVMWRLPRDERGFALGATFVLFAFSLANKQSFFNEWTLVLQLLVLSAATLARRAYDGGAALSAAGAEHLAAGPDAELEEELVGEQRRPQPDEHAVQPTHQAAQAPSLAGGDHVERQPDRVARPDNEAG